jgi:hypothetical protein
MPEPDRCSGLTLQIPMKSGQANPFVEDKIGPEAVDKFADFRRAAAPLDWEGVLQCGKVAARVVQR